MFLFRIQMKCVNASVQFGLQCGLVVDHGVAKAVVILADHCVLGQVELVSEHVLVPLFYPQRGTACQINLTVEW